MPRRKVLVSAYACEPGKGSEPGAGWLWALAAARTSDVWVLTRANNRAPIEAHPASAAPTLRFVYVDLPRRLRGWKRRGRGIRLYYVLWQLGALRAARRLHARERFDVVHHVTFANLWLPALACVVDAPFVIGPAGGGQAVARDHYRALGPRGVVKETALRAARRLAGVNPLVRLAWRRASIILLNNRETRLRLPSRVRSKTMLRPGQCADGLEPAPATPPAAPPKAVYAGRLHRFKGVDLALRALALVPEWRLLVVGGGPELERLRGLARRLGVDGRVEFHPPVDQQRLWRLMAGADAFVLPSLKEGGGFAALEAAALGLPVVAFRGGGPGAVADFYPQARFELVSPADSYRGLAAALERLGKRRVPGPALDAGIEAVAADLERVYACVDGRSARRAAADEPTLAGRTA
jgi:glycosyltransferase involved in cell wall biosynthesis